MAQVIMSVYMIISASPLAARRPPPAACLFFTPLKTQVVYTYNNCGEKQQMGLIKIRNNLRDFGNSTQSWQFSGHMTLQISQWELFQPCEVVLSCTRSPWLSGIYIMQMKVILLFSDFQRESLPVPVQNPDSSKELIWDGFSHRTILLNMAMITTALGTSQHPQ